MLRSLKFPILRNIMVVASAAAMLASAAQAAPAKAKPKPMPAAHGPLVSLPVAHGIWLTGGTPCAKAFNMVLMRYDPLPACVKSYTQVGPNVFKDQICLDETHHKSTYVIKSRTEMTIDGEAWHFCPPASLDPIYR